ncbi:MAG: 50S ribosomal protein L24 [Mariprofundales bacterium]
MKKINRSAASAVNSRLRRGDEIIVVAGRDRGLRGRIMQVRRSNGRVLVSKVNLIKRHTKPTKDSAGGIVEQEAAIAISNVMYYCPHCKKGVRLSSKTLDDDRKVRGCRVCGEVLDT